MEEKGRHEAVFVRYAEKEKKKERWPVCWISHFLSLFFLSFGLASMYLSPEKIKRKDG